MIMIAQHILHNFLFMTVSCLIFAHFDSQTGAGAEHSTALAAMCPQRQRLDTNTWSTMIWYATNTLAEERFTRIMWQCVRSNLGRETQSKTRDLMAALSNTVHKCSPLRSLFRDGLSKDRPNFLYIHARHKTAIKAQYLARRTRAHMALLPTRMTMCATNQRFIARIAARDGLESEIRTRGHCCSRCQ